MKSLVVSLAFLFNALICIGQHKVNFCLNNKFRIEGVVFERNYIPRFQIKDSLSRFTPSLENIKLCEGFLLMNQPYVSYIDLQGVYVKDNLKNVLKNFKRQYIGYIGLNKDSIVLVQLLNFKKRTKANYKFEGWEREFIIGFGDFYEYNTVRFKVNISRKIVSLF